MCNEQLLKIPGEEVKLCKHSGKAPKRKGGGRVVVITYLEGKVMWRWTFAEDMDVEFHKQVPIRLTIWCKHAVI